MDHFAGMDVSVKETSICIVNDTVLFSALAEVGLPVICVETRHMRAVLQAQINKMVCPG